MHGRATTTLFLSKNTAPDTALSYGAWTVTIHESILNRLIDNNSSGSRSSLVVNISLVATLSSISLVVLVY
jgi:hypothetical protein